ncbi:ABC transporter ATP-binding protein [Oceanobacillus kapialis]|uniref:ABC transporter ATP-binding protein n=1 Tax=Oceanobacillus kapialis TaxID=481353 RepID=A0ABW5PWB8_9BACI
MLENILEVNGLYKAYANSDFGLNNISFSIPSGSIVGFIGENGAGKTTTMETILGLLRKDSGQIKLFGEEVDSLEGAMKEQVGVVFDHMNFSKDLVVGKLSNVLSNIYQQWDEATFFHYVRHFSLPKKKKIKDFSRGMTMKLALAVAFSHDSKLLILDEATAGLDPVARDEMLDVFLDFVKDREHSILLSSHITTDIEKIADYLVFIKKGRILLRVSKRDLLENYAIVQGKSSEIAKLHNVIAHRDMGDVTEALVADKASLPIELNQLDFSIDAITMLLMKGENHERAIVK